jgi:hypothetical protein
MGLHVGSIGRTLIDETKRGRSASFGRTPSLSGIGLPTSCPPKSGGGKELDPLPYRP